MRRGGRESKRGYRLGITRKNATTTREINGLAIRRHCTLHKEIDRNATDIVAYCYKILRLETQ